MNLMQQTEPKNAQKNDFQQIGIFWRSFNKNSEN